MRRWLLLAALACSACGDDTTLVLVEVELAYDVPGELDLLHFQLNDDVGLFAERSYALEPGETEASLALYPGGRTAVEFDVVVVGLLDNTPVAQSEPVHVRVIEGDEHIVRIRLP
jgi:hypothetical protein